VGACEPRQIREEAALSNASQARGAPGPGLTWPRRPAQRGVTGRRMTAFPALSKETSAHGRAGVNAALGKLPDRAKRAAHPPLVVDAGVGLVAEVVHVLARHALQRRPKTPLRAAPVAKDVRCDSEQPGQRRVVLKLHVSPASPGLEEDDRREVFCERPIRGAAEEVVVDRARVALEHDAKRLRPRRPRLGAIARRR
jgi:hypothetical protein